MRHIKKSILALSLSCSIVNQNAMIITNAQNFDSEKTASKSSISQDSLEDVTFQQDPLANPNYSMGGYSSNRSLPNLNLVQLTNPRAIGNGTVSANTLNVRSNPSTSSEILGTVQNGDNFDIIQKEKDWYKISFDGKDGYVSSNYISLNPIQKGIDVSKWNGTIDWNKVKASGIDYVIIRAGYGTSTLDPTFSKNMQGALNAGLEVGVYWFSYATTPAKAQEEAKFCLNALAPYKSKISYPVFFDYEYDSVEYAKKQGVTITKSLATDFANTFIKEVENQGYESGIYTNQDFGDRYFTNDALLTHNLWIAQYRSSIAYSRPYMMWQYTEKGTVNGISGYVDMNYTYLKPNSKSIDPINLSKASLSNISSQAHTGSEIMPEFQVTLNEKVLTEGKDYKTAYKDNVSIGNAEITITGIGAYSGSIKKSFKIVPKKVTDLKVVDKTSSSIKLQWSKISGVTGYKLYKYDKETDSYRLLKTLEGHNTLTYTNTKLSANTKYSYKVRAYKTISSDRFWGSYSDVVSESTLSSTTATKYGTTTANVNMRSAATTDSSIITTIAKDTKIEVLEKTSSSWYKVKYNGKTGYVSATYLNVDGNSSSTNPPTTATKYGTTTANVNMRSAATTDSSIITTIAKDTKIEVLEKTSSWYKVKYNGKIGYVSATYLNVDGNNTSTNTKYGVTTGKVNMRSSATTKSSIITSIPKGTKLEVIEKTTTATSSWYKIKYNGKAGYVSAKYFSIDGNTNSNNTK